MQYFIRKPELREVIQWDGTEDSYKEICKAFPNVTFTIKPNDQLKATLKEEILCFPIGTYFEIMFNNAITFYPSTHFNENYIEISEEDVQNTLGELYECYYYSKELSHYNK